MDLGAYAQIDDLISLAKENGIYVPRLRGYRLMSKEETVSDKEIHEMAISKAMTCCDDIVRTGVDCWWSSDHVAEKRAKKYLIADKEHKWIVVGVRWDKVHGKLRKRLKYEVKKSIKRHKKQFEIWNNYCGQNVLYIHARIGGNNWPYYCNEVKDQPWFIEKVDDAFDATYCDIYARLI